MDAQDSGAAVVQAWHDALNTGDLDRLPSLMAADIAFGGPRGEGRGAVEVPDWAQRSGIRLEPERWFEKDGMVIVAQRARWLDPVTGEPGPAQEIASAFQVRDGVIQRVVRYGSLEEALEAVGNDAAKGGA